MMIAVFGIQKKMVNACVHLSGACGYKKEEKK
jgi:hypothetical protein